MSCRHFQRTRSLSPVATISQMTDWRFSKTVNIESTTVRHFNSTLPVAAVAEPVETDPAFHSLEVGRETTLKPAGSMRTAAVFRDAVGWHVISRQSTKAIPSSREVIVTEERVVPLRSGSVRLVQPSILSAL